MEPEKTTSEEVVATATAHAEALEASRKESMASMLSSPELSQTLEDAVVRALGRGASENRYIDIGRIPFICDDIKTISEQMIQMNKNMATYPIVRALVFGLVVAVLLAVLGEVLFSIGLGHAASLSPTV